MKRLSEKRQTKPKLRVKKIELQGSDFLLEFENCIDGYSEFPNFNACNLYLPKTVNKGKHNERTELKWVCYPTLQNAISYIINYRIVKSGDCVFKGKGDEGLAKFFNRYRNERNKLISLVNHSQEEWMNLLECDKKKKSYKAILE